MNFGKFLKAPFSQNTFGRLLLYMVLNLFKNDHMTILINTNHLSIKIKLHGRNATDRENLSLAFINRHLGLYISINYLSVVVENSL